MQQDDRIFAVVGACTVFAVALVAALMWLNSGISVDAPQRATVVVPQTVPTPEASVVPASRVVEASLSDMGEEGLFRHAVARLSTHPELASYLVHDRLLRRFVNQSKCHLLFGSDLATRFILRGESGRAVGQPGDLTLDRAPGCLDLMGPPGQHATRGRPAPHAQGGRFREQHVLNRLDLVGPAQDA